MKEIVAETQAKRNNRENESHFRKQPADQNSPPVDSCATHFSIPVPACRTTRDYNNQG